MHHFKTISEYCQFIQIAPPDYSHFDIRSFEENMPLVVKRTPPFRHEFFAIAIKVDGEGKAVSGFHKDFPKGPVIFFNTPYQILSWDIEPNWKGYYFMFTQDFIAQAGHFHRLLEKFPFLRMDQSIPLEIDPSGVKEIMQVYHHIYNEYYGLKPDKFQLIEVHVLLILNLVKRYFSKHIHRASSKQRKTADLHLITRYQTLIQTSFFHGTTAESTANIHSTSYYAEKLNVHPNHLNAVVKRNTGITALSLIHNHLLQLAKSYLIQTRLTIKEVAYNLSFDSPNSFNNFFKKHTHVSPTVYRQKFML